MSAFCGDAYRVSRRGAWSAQGHVYCSGELLPADAAPQRSFSRDNIGMALRRRCAAKVALHEQRGCVDMHAPLQRPGVARGTPSQPYHASSVTELTGLYNHRGKMLTRQHSSNAAPSLASLAYEMLHW